ncbi:VRR-NUC domain-containing protein [Pseudaminobacter sp. NGMCC 1.201702]|uniref:VRR-NUC domain-containing protein n=1 Tax=Pseudaminobacter sp. NGMCC 1.201702 TaxID=3391825 RepID=UPI0039F14AAF
MTKSESTTALASTTSNAPGKRRQTTVTIKGKRMVVTTTAAGVTTVKTATPQEWECQSEQVRRLRRIPGVLFVGGMEAGKRGPRARMIALATGLTAGHPDLTIFMPGGRCAFIENKVGNGRLSPAQVARHTALRKLGFEVEVVRASSTDEAGDKAVELVKKWLTANDNNNVANAIYGT